VGVWDGSVESYKLCAGVAPIPVFFRNHLFERSLEKDLLCQASPMQMAACFPIATALPEPMHSHRKEGGFDAVHAALVSPDRSRDALHTMAPLPSDERHLQIRVAV
jgi:hypothetical protein